MKPRTKWAIIFTLLLLGYGLAVVWFWNNLPRPYERPPARTKMEQAAVDKLRPRIGHYTVVDCKEGIYFKLPNGKRWAVRRIQ